jgi:exonuclease VII small subunit
MSIITTLEQLPEGLRALVEAELKAAEEKGRQLEKQAQEELAKRSMTMADIMKERNAAQETIKKVLEGAGVTATKVGMTNFYDRAQVVKAFIAKDRNILKFHGLLHMVEPSSTEQTTS